jgi:hypothetical protein
MIAALVMGPTCVAQMKNRTSRTAKLVPVFSKERSHRSLRVPTPTVKQGPQKRPARLRDTAMVAKFWEHPPTMVKIKARGSVMRKTIIRP